MTSLKRVKNEIMNYDYNNSYPRAGKHTHVSDGRFLPTLYRRGEGQNACKMHIFDL